VRWIPKMTPCCSLLRHSTKSMRMFCPSELVIARQCKPKVPQIVSRLRNRWHINIAKERWLLKSTCSDSGSAFTKILPTTRLVF
jgi:hypothetical protein